MRTLGRVYAGNIWYMQSGYVHMQAESGICKADTGICRQHLVYAKRMRAYAGRSGYMQSGYGYTQATSGICKADAGICGQKLVHAGGYRLPYGLKVSLRTLGGGRLALKVSLRS